MKTELQYSELRKEKVEVSRLHPEDGFLYLKDNPELWFQSNSPERFSSVRCLELYLRDYTGEGEPIGDSIGKLSELTHLCIKQRDYVKLRPQTISRLSKLQHLALYDCFQLEELPANLGELQSLTSLHLECLPQLKSLPDGVVKLSNLSALTLFYCSKLEELPANLGELQSLTCLSLFYCNGLMSLPRSITKLSKLRFLGLPINFRLYKLPSSLDESIVISVAETHLRITWKELKSQMQHCLPLPLPLIPGSAVDVAHFPLTPGYLHLKEDPTPWIKCNYGLHSFVRLLDLQLEDYIGNKIALLESIGQLPKLTHLYISHGYLSNQSLMLLFQRFTHVSLHVCDFECATIYPHFDSLGNLPKLQSLHLLSDFDEELPTFMHLPFSLRYLSLSSADFQELHGTYMASLANLTNLKTLDLFRFCDLDLLPLNLHLTKLILRNSTIKSLPMGLQHLEILHVKEYCKTQSCNDINVCLNQLFNLKKLSYTCYQTEFIPSISSLHNLQELQLKDCFKLKELPSNLEELVNLCTLDLSGTRIKSFSNGITKLHNLESLILPKCFKLESLPQYFGKEVMIFVDDTCEEYYMHAGYYDSCYDKVDRIMSGTMKKLNGVVVKESRTENIIEKQAQLAQHRPLSQLPGAVHMSEGSYFPSRTDPISNDCYHASSVQNHEMNILPAGNTMQVHASIELEVSKSTMKSALKEYRLTWSSNRKRKLQDPCNRAAHGHGAEHLDGANRLTLSDYVPSESNGVKDSTSDAVICTVEEPPKSSQCHMDCHQHIAEYSNGVQECALWNPLQPNGSSSTFVVKAAYKKDAARFHFSLGSSIEKLKEEVGKSLELEVGKFKVKYQDDEKEWMLMNRISDLEHALSLSRSSGSNVVRLLIELKE